MEEIILTNKKHGMRTLVVFGLLTLLAFAGIIVFAVCAEEGILEENLGNIAAIVCAVVMCVAWFPLIGLRILKPQEALALTLFGKYVGTIKGEGL